jgi:RNA polymerase sigma factor (sigma-70 family)
MRAGSTMSTSIRFGKPLGQPFFTTRWTLVLRANSSDTVEAREAWGALCSIYWGPLYAYCRKRGYSHQDSEDSVQTFLARLYERESLQSVAREKGRFRSFLLKSFTNYLTNEYYRTHAQKRGEGVVAVPIGTRNETGEWIVDPADPRTPEQVFDKQCALAIVHEVLQALEEELKAAGKTQLFAALKPYLLGDAEGQLKKLAMELHLSEGALRVALFRLRERFRAVLREIVGATVTRAEDVDDELRSLTAALMQG